MADHGYACELCGRTLVSPRSDEAARDEAAAQWPGVPISEMAKICHTCYLRLMEWLATADRH